VVLIFDKFIVNHIAVLNMDTSAVNRSGKIHFCPVNKQVLLFNCFVSR